MEPEPLGAWRVTRSSIPEVLRGWIVRLALENGETLIVQHGEDTVLQVARTEVNFVSEERTTGILRIVGHSAELHGASAPPSWEVRDRLLGIIPQPVAEEDTRPRPIVVRSYPGRTQRDAAIIFARDAAIFSAEGYHPVAQSWADGRPGIARVVTLGLAASALRPAGYLTVTYELKATGPTVEAPAATKVCPECAETVLAAARICRYCRHEFKT